MHEMMIQKGFTLKSEDEIEKIRREKQPLRLKDEMRRKQREEMRNRMINNRNWKTGQTQNEEREAGGVDSSDKNAGDIEDLYGDDGVTSEQLADMEREMKRRKWNQVLQERERMEKQKDKDDAESAASGSGMNGGRDEL